MSFLSRQHNEPNEITLSLPKMHPAQAKVIQQSRRFNVCCLGRRSGKTVLGMNRIIDVALASLPAAWFGPTYKSASDVWRELKTLLYPVTDALNEQEKRLQVKGGGSIECWSLADPDAGRGRSYACVVVDEAAQVADLQHAWEQSIRPMLSDHRGSAWFLSTPRGTSNYFYTLWRRGQGILPSNWKSWQLPTSCNPHIKPEEIAEMREDMTDQSYDQEVLAQFVSWTGSVFRKIMDAVMTSPATGKACVIGCDWGRTNDYTVFAVLSDQGELLELDRFRGQEYRIQQDRLLTLWDRHGRPPVFSEANSMGGVLNEQLRRDGIPVRDFVTTNASKAEAIGALQLGFEQGTIHIPNDPVLIGELQAFEAKPLAGGLMRYEAPSGGHDDTVMALAIAWQGVVAGRSYSSALFMPIGVMFDGAENRQVPFYRPSPWRIQ